MSIDIRRSHRRGLSADAPFVGLRPFGFDDREFYFGREEQIFALYRILERSRFIAVVGSSGSGKSSLVGAGLLPLLQEESGGTGGRHWHVVSLHPGAAPVASLADALCQSVTAASPDAELSRIRRERTEQLLRGSSFGLNQAIDEIRELDRRSVLCVVDQFEEIFRYGRSERPRDEALDARWRDETINFVQLLLEGTRSRSGRLRVLITMRSDFIGDCAGFYGLPEAVSGAQFLVPSLTRGQREDVIRKPLDKANATIEPALVERMLNDLGNDPDQLPVLQHTLSRLWERTDRSPDGRRVLSMAQYDCLGGVRGALSQHAEEVMALLPGKELAIEQAFRALSETDREGRATRRAVPFRRLVEECGVAEGDLRSVLDRFRDDDCLFIVPSYSALPWLEDETRVDVVHEALLRNWTRISADSENVLGQPLGWLEAEAADGRYYRAMIALLEAAPRATSATLPPEQVTERWEWWRSRPRTDAWAARYGGRLASVEGLFTTSLAALREKRRREANAERERRELSEHKVKLAMAHQERRRLVGVGAQAFTLLLCAIIFVYAIILVRNDRQVQNDLTRKNAALQSNIQKLTGQQHHGTARSNAPAKPAP